MRSPESADARQAGQAGFERWVAAAALGVLALAVLARAPGYLAGDEPVGDDSSSHVVASAAVADCLRSGAGWWADEFNLGFPLAHFYQPLPHVVTGALALALGGPEHAATAYKALVVLLLLALPFAAFVGFSRLGLGRGGALAAALVLATLSAPKAFFGLTARHYLLVGLYTLLWGAVVAPLALGEGVRFLQGRGRASLAVLAFALLFLAHGLLALGLVPVFVFTAFFAREDDSTLVARLRRLVVLGALTGVVIAFWLLPQLACSDYFGGWPIARGEVADGLGLRAVLFGWVRGRLTDFHRAPVLAALSIVGVVAALVRWRSPVARVVLFGVALFVVFAAGRVTFGRLVDWIYPVNARIEGMLRWMALLQLFLALAAGLGAELLLAFARRGSRRVALAAFALLPGALLGATLPGTLSDLRQGLATFPPEQARTDYLAAAGWLAEARAPGRVYTAEPVGHATHWSMNYLALLARKPMTLSYGVGVQDSLNFAYLWLFGGGFEGALVRDPARAGALAELLGVRYVLARPDVDLRYLGGTTLGESGPYRVLELPRAVDSTVWFDVVPAPEVLVEPTPIAARPRLEAWLARDFPRGAPYLRLAEPVHARLPALPSARRAEPAAPGDGAKRLGKRGARPGRVLEEHASRGEYRARIAVTEDEGWALLRATPHPWWRAEVDGRSAPIYYLSPAFQGLPLGRGEHEVTFTFENPRWQTGLLALAPLVLVGLFLVGRRARR
jgi:hypothetical protein